MTRTVLGMALGGYRTVTISVAIARKELEFSAMTNRFLIPGSRVQVAQGAPLIAENQGQFHPSQELASVSLLLAACRV